MVIKNKISLVFCAHNEKFPHLAHEPISAAGYHKKDIAGQSDSCWTHY
jgi:hypothetical protein